MLTLRRALLLPALLLAALPGVLFARRRGEEGARRILLARHHGGELSEADLEELLADLDP